MNIGLQITKNKIKYDKLLKLFPLEILKSINFIHIKDDNSLKNYISDLDALVCYEINRNIFINRGKKLKWIHIGAAGIEDSLHNEVIKSNVIITNAKGIHVNPVSEYVICCMLYFAKNFNEFYNFKINRFWNQWELAKNMSQLSGKTVGILGFGCIGKAIAKKAKAFDMNVIATRRLQKKVESKKIVDRLVPISDIDVIFKESDYVVVACPLTPLTHNLVDQLKFKLMKKDSVFINISRGKIVNETHLISFLKKKFIKGAALDVFTDEPLNSKSELYDLDNVIISPHVSGNFPEYQSEMIKQYSIILQRFLDKKTLINRVCKKRLY